MDGEDQQSAAPSLVTRGIHFQLVAFFPKKACQPANRSAAHVLREHLYLFGLKRSSY